MDLLKDFNPKRFHCLLFWAGSFRKEGACYPHGVMDVRLLPLPMNITPAFSSAERAYGENAKNTRLLG